MIIQEIIAFKPIDIDSVIEEERQGYASELMPGFRTVLEDLEARENLVKRSVLEVIA